MQGKDFELERPRVVGGAHGVVLEVGFGSGLNLPYYQNISKLYALDPSEELYSLAKKRIENVSFPVEHLNASAEEIPLDSESVDTVVSTWSLCSIPDPNVALKEIRRVLKPQGKFLFIEHGKSLRPRVAVWQKRLTPISKCFAGGCHLDRDIKQLIMDAGFKFEQMEKFDKKSKPLSFMYKGVAVKTTSLSSSN